MLYSDVDAPHVPDWLIPDDCMSQERTGKEKEKKWRHELGTDPVSCDSQSSMHCSDFLLNFRAKVEVN